MAATFRESFNISAHDIGIDHSVSWPEAYDLISVALEDPATALFTSVTGWTYRASTVDLMLLMAQVGKDAEKVMPWYRVDVEDDPVTEEEIQAVYADLLEKIHFTD